MGIVKSLSIYSLGTIILSAVNFALVPVYSKYLDPREYGILNMILIFISVFTIINDLGLKSTLQIRFYKISTKNRGSYIGEILLVLVIVNIFISAVGIIFSGRIQRVLGISIDPLYWYLILLIISLSVITNLFSVILRLLERAKMFVTVSIVKTVILGSLNILFLVKYHMSYEAYIYSLIGMNMAVLVTMFVFLHRSFTMSYRFSMISFKEKLAIGLPIVPHGLLSIVMTSGDRYILNQMLSLSAVGIYSMGYKFGNLFQQLVLNPFNNAFFPMLSRRYSSSAREYASLLGRVLQFYFSLSLIYLIGFSTFLDSVFWFLIDPKYWPSINIVQIVAVSLIIFGFGLQFNTTILLEEKTYITPILTLLGGIVNIGANIILIRKYGIIGAALATMASYLIVTILQIMISTRLVRIEISAGFYIKNIILFVPFYGVCIGMTNLNDFSIARLSIRIGLLLIFIFIYYVINHRFLKNIIEDLK